MYFSKSSFKHTGKHDVVFMEGYGFRTTAATATATAAPAATAATAAEIAAANTTSPLNWSSSA